MGQYTHMGQNTDKRIVSRSQTLLLTHVWHAICNKIIATTTSKIRCNITLVRHQIHWCNITLTQRNITPTRLNITLTQYRIAYIDFSLCYKVPSLKCKYRCVWLIPRFHLRMTTDCCGGGKRSLKSFEP